MNHSFKTVDIEGFSSVAKVIEDLPSNFCDHTPYVILTWQKYYDTAFAIIEGVPFIRNTVDNEYCYCPLTQDVCRAAEVLLKHTPNITLSLVDDKAAELLKSRFKVTHDERDEGWADYVYLHSDLAQMSGKRYSGQRNHINAFTSAHPHWSYEEITEENMGEVLEFYKELTRDTSGYDATALYEREWLIEYLGGCFKKLPLRGGLIREESGIAAFAFGEVIRDMLYVHVEKARRDVRGAYQMIVREFASHNPALLINREEDMGIEGLRASKQSYHPIRKEYKHKLRIEK